VPVVADFKVISDAKVTLKWNSPNSSAVFKFSLPGLSGVSPAVLSFLCIAKGNTGNLGSLAFEMFLNGKSVLAYGFSGFETMTLHEVIGSGLFSSSNELFIKTLSGDGELAISDLVLWYKRTI
jgi:hypothetical protein